MTFQDAVRSGLENYANFEGRDGRPAFWYWVLFAILVGIVAAIIDAILGTDGFSATGGLVGTISSLVLLVPGLAVGCRRLHDIGKSGWWQAVALIPLVGWIYLIYLFAQAGNPAPNQYGPPKGVTPATA